MGIRTTTTTTSVLTLVQQHPTRSLPMSLTSLEQTSDINLARYRQYLFAQRRVSEWVQQIRPDATQPLYSRPKDRKEVNTNRNIGKLSSRRSRTSKDHNRGTHGYNNTPRMMLTAEKAPIAPVIALVSSSLMVWALDLLPSIVGIFGFAVLLNLATTSIDDKVRVLSLVSKKDDKIDYCKDKNEKGS